MKTAWAGDGNSAPDARLSALEVNAVRTSGASSIVNPDDDAEFVLHRESCHYGILTHFVPSDLYLIPVVLSVAIFPGTEMQAAEC